ncbi:MAG: ATP-binding protein [Chloroflexi bacterium]|nr:ATP-binding protein [Chloroflexota bacterium]
MTNKNRNSIQAQLRVPIERLTTYIDEATLGFTSTQEVSPLEGTIGQDRALRALDFGLDVDAPGFNIFVAGNPGSGRNTTLSNVLRKLAASQPVPNDWVYVYNFRDASRPRGISFPPGAGRAFSSGMAALVDEAKARIPRAFEGPEYRHRVDAALTNVHAEHRLVTDAMVAEAKTRGVGLALTEAGVIATPLAPSGEPLTPEQIDNLNAEDTAKLQEAQKGVEEFISERIATLRTLEREAARTRRQLDREITEYVLQGVFAEIREAHAGHEEALAYLDEVLEDMVNNLPMFVRQERGGGPTGVQEMMMEMAGGEGDDMVRYQVNVFVDRTTSHGAPVVFEESPTYLNVFGRVRHTVRQGVMTTDFTMLGSGALHQANGGFLVLQVVDILTNPLVWQSLKQALHSGQARLENISEQFSMVATSGLEPEPIPLDLKVILVGNAQLARALMLYDEDFAKLFKVKAEFGYELELNTENIKKHAQFVVNRVQENGIPHFEASGVARLIEHSSRLVENQQKLTSRFSDIADLITEAAYCAKQAGHALVTGDDVHQAVHEHRLRSNMVEDRLQDLYEDGTIHLDVDGEVVGQINGLAVIDMGDYSFGRPSRLTARVSLGRGEFGNVEQAAQMSGRIHSKGFQILIGYLMGKYGIDATLPVRVSIAFEQTYQEVDGDSAASTELYALLSALADAPIKQGFAVTGSVDQHGHVQAIGGATRKIEGFFEVCKAKGLTGEQGVLIPASNVSSLVLRQEVVDAVKAGQFNVYAIETVEQGIELLTGVAAGELDDEGHYPDDSINARVVNALEAMSERVRDTNGPRAPRDLEKPVTIEEPQGRERDPREGPGAPPEPQPKAGD